MAYAKIDDRLPWHPKIVGLSDAAFRAYVTGICYATAHLTDGLVPTATVADPSVAADLVRAGLWITARTGWMVHDWHEWNPTAEQIRLRRKAARERMRRQRRGDDGRYEEGESG